MKKTCPWPQDDPLMVKYHDREWGVPLHDDRRLFEYLILDAFQAGLSWRTTLHKRENFRQAFRGFDPHRVAGFRQADVRRLMSDAGIIRNRLKIEAGIKNARAFLAVQQEFGSFDRYIWSFVGGRPVANRWQSPRQIPTRSPQSDRMARDLKARGFGFAGTTICYAFMQAAGLVNDHLVCCFRHREINQLQRKEPKR